jgi:prefoldin alpha subunit
VVLLVATTITTLIITLCAFTHVIIYDGTKIETNKQASTQQHMIKRTKQKEEVEQDVQYRAIAETLQQHQASVRKLRESLNHLQQLKERIPWLRDQLKVESMLPIGEGQLAFMHGELVHTNEWTILLGENYFVKCTSARALDILNRRVNTIQNSLNREQQVLHKMYDQFSNRGTTTVGHTSATVQYSSVDVNSEPGFSDSNGIDSSNGIDAEEELRRGLFEALEQYRRENIVEIREEYNEQEETIRQQREQQLGGSDNHHQSEEGSKSSVNWNELTDLLHQMLKEAAERGGEEEENDRQEMMMDLKQKLLKMEQEKLRSKQQETIATRNPIIKKEIVEELGQEFARYFHHHIPSQKQDETNGEFTSSVASTTTTTTATATTAITDSSVAQKPAKAISVGKVVERVPVVQTQQPQPQALQAKKKVSKFKQMLQSQQQ